MRISVATKVGSFLGLVLTWTVLWISTPRLAAAAQGSSCEDSCMSDLDCQVPPGAAVPVSFECAVVSCDPDDPFDGPTARKCIPKGAAEGHPPECFPPPEKELADDSSPFFDSLVTPMGAVAPMNGMASVQAGAFQGELGEADLAVNNGVAEALFSDLPELDGLLAVQGQLGPSLCFNLEVTNPQQSDAFFFLAFGMPAQIGASDPFGIVSSLFAEIEDTSGDGSATVADLMLMMDGRTEEDVVTFFSDVDVGPISGSTEMAFSGLAGRGFDRLEAMRPDTVAAACPAAGPTPSFGAYTEISLFLSFTLSPGDSLFLRGQAIAAPEPGDGPPCNIPAVRPAEGAIFADGFESGDTASWGNS